MQPSLVKHYFYRSDLLLYFPVFHLYESKEGIQMEKQRYSMDFTCTPRILKPVLRTPLFRL